MAAPSHYIQLTMKGIAIALLLGLALTSNTNRWNVVDTLPDCYTGIPFEISLGNNDAVDYSYSLSDLPTWATFDDSKGAITGSSKQAGAWPINVKVSDKSGKQANKQYILHVVNANSDSNSVWASNETTNYYQRKVDKPLRVAPSSKDSTILKSGDKFSYKFGTENAVGSPVFAFLNLPEGLTGDTKTGTISGVFAVLGIYTLGVESADQSGNTSEGFVTVTVGDGSSSASQVSSLNKVTVDNVVPFVYDVSAVQQ